MFWLNLETSTLLAVELWSVSGASVAFAVILDFISLVFGLSVLYIAISVY